MGKQFDLMSGLSLPLLFGLAHGISDSAAGFLVGILLQMNVSPAGDYWIFLYNALAFGLQPVAGLVCDRWSQPKRFAALGLTLTAVGLAIAYWALPLSVMLLGLGSALFHAAGGAVAIVSTPRRASGPGVFAAFGVIGLALGLRLSLRNSFPVILAFACVVIVFALALWFARSSTRADGNTSSQAASVEGNEIWIILLVMAFAFRSFVWSGIDRRVDDFTSLALWLALAAGAGKFLGGIASDVIGWRRWVVGSLALSLLLFVFGHDAALFLLAGVFLLQSVTALTIAAFGQMLPGSPALAASLGLGAAVILGGLPFVITQQGWGNWGIIVALIVSIAGYWFVLRKQTT